MKKILYESKQTYILYYFDETMGDKFRRIIMDHGWVLICRIYTLNIV